MNHESPDKQSNPNLVITIINYFFFLSALWGGISTLILLSIPGDPKNAWLLGFSKTRLGMLLGLLFVTLILLGIGILFWRKQGWARLLAQKLNWLALEFGYFYPLLILAFGITVLVPYFYMFLVNPLEGFYLRVFPFVLFISLITIQTFVALSLIVRANRKALEVENSRQYTLQLDPRKAAVILLSITVVFILANISNNMIQLAGYAPELTRYTDKLDMDGEINIPTFYNSFLLFAPALLFAIISWLQGRQDPFYRSWVTLSVIFIYLSIDESTKIHELLTKPLRDGLHTGGIWLYAWVIVAIPILIILTIVFLPFVLHLPRKTKFLIVLAAVVYVGGALGLEMVAGEITTLFGNQNISYMFLATIEETLEYSGLIILIYGLLDYISTQFNQQSILIKRRNT